MAIAKIEVWACVDAQGDYGVGVDEDGAKTAYVETIGPLEESGGFRCYLLSLRVPVPDVVEVSGEVSEGGGEVRLSVVV